MTKGGYIAKALGVSIITQAQTIEELRQTVREAAHCHFEDTDTKQGMIRLHLVKDEVFAA